ncbi:MAG TPA: hypothetical protein VHK90_01490, partial [Thermoanaerobaculia bacterium]|nr:hypothetical protein [Thermoanaerobaculia bacterium]
LSFSARARDVSQDATNFGSELPVVREQQMVRDGAATLLDIPVDDRYRVKVRIYAFDESTNDTMQVSFTTEQNGTRTTGPLRTLQRTCHADECAWTPYYGEVDLPAGAAGARVNVYIDESGTATPVLLWAMASVTNNRTQQVTIVSARGASDVCRNCTQ